MSSNGPQLSPWGHALAGAMGAVFANAVVYPLDTVKTRIQASSDDSKPSTSSSTAASDLASTSDKAIPSTEQQDEDSESEATILARVNRKLGLSPPSSSSSSTLGSNAILNLLLKITREEGLSGFYKGFLANMLNTFSMQYAYFFFYSLVRSLYIKRLTRRAAAAASKRAGAGGVVAGMAAVQLGTAAELILGAAAGALAQIFTLPVAVVATRQQLENKPRGMLDVAKEIIDEDGIGGLWNGIKPGLVLTVNPAITYGAFERLKGIALQSSGKDKLSPGTAFVVGAASKSLATIVTYPYIMAKVRLQAKHVDDPTSSTSGSPASKSTRPQSAIEVLQRVYKEKGFAGWYQGMSAQIFKAVLSQGILFMLKDQFESYAFLLLLLFSNSTSSVISKAQTIASHVPHPDVHLPSSLPPLPSSLKEATAALPSLPSLPAVPSLPSVASVPSAISEKVPGLMQDVKGVAEAFGERTGVKATVDMVVNAVEGK